MRPFFDDGSKQPEQAPSPAVQPARAWAIRDPPDRSPQEPTDSILGGLEVPLKTALHELPSTRTYCVMVTHTSRLRTCPAHPGIYRRHLLSIGRP